MESNEMMNIWPNNMTVIERRWSCLIYNILNKEAQMRKFIKLSKATIMLSGIVLLVSACGGGGGSGIPDSPTTPQTSSKLSGTAAAGAPIIGLVTVKDSSTPVAQTKTVQIAADGKYSVDVTGLKAPYMVRADGYVGGNEYHLYSAATVADVNGTINITPLTDLIIANIAGTIAQSYFDSGNFSNLTATQLTTQSNRLAAQLQPILTAVGVNSSIDLLRASFNTDHTGLDAALDVIRVSTDTATNIATISNICTTENIKSNLSTGVYTSTLTSATTTAVASTSTDIQAINEVFKKFSALFATSLPSATNPNLLALFDSPTFLQQGQNLAAFLSDITTQKTIIGVSFTNISIMSIDTATNRALVRFNVMQSGSIQIDAPSWYMIKKNGIWYLQGDQHIAEVGIDSFALNSGSITPASITTGLHIEIRDRGGRGITSAVVTGAGLIGPVTLVPQINDVWFTIQGKPYSTNFYEMNDTQINAIADSGEVYTVQLYIGTVLQATYTEKLKKRPYLNSQLTAASFPVITSPTLTQLRSFKGGNITVNWTLPTGSYSDWLEVSLWDNSTNSVTVGTDLLRTDTTKTLTVNPVTNGGVTFTPTGSEIYLTAIDIYGRSLVTTLY